MLFGRQWGSFIAPQTLIALHYLTKLLYAKKDMEYKANDEHVQDIIWDDLSYNWENIKKIPICLHAEIT